MKNIVFAVWFGKLPVYFPLWMQSLTINKDYDFVLVTDQKVIDQIPENLRIVNLTLNQLKAQFRDSLGITPSFEYSYKICDFRPAFGKIFEKYLTGYAFWGYCDIDLMFGKLSDFISPEILSRYDKIFNRGHFTLYKNNPVVNKLYRCSKKIDHVQIFESPETFIFDEWHGIHQIFKEFNLSQYHKECIADILPNAARFVCSNLKNYKKQLFVWQDGLVKQYYLSGGELQVTEVAYIHFQKRKIKINNIKAFKGKGVIFNSFEFIPFEGEITASLVQKYDEANYYHYLNRRYKTVLKKLSLPGKPAFTINTTLVSRPIDA
jgi:hypothetical protein